MTDLATTVTWSTKAIIAGLGLGIFPLILGVFEHRGLRNEVTMAWWLLGTAAGFFLLAKIGGGGIMNVQMNDFFEHRSKVVAVLLLGATCGMVINLFYGQSILGAPSPAIAVAIIEAAIILTYLAAPLINIFLPGVFPDARINWMGLFGILVTCVGITIVWYAK